MTVSLPVEQVTKHLVQSISQSINQSKFHWTWFLSINRECRVLCL